ncbi:MAG: peptidoglycan DD-metalloendopeptidase family protein [Candidatus Wallbacteria bacterium]|nr:peptidoglycan DD-metalloendopeptidase family protein [Candidatus Wallbacteria bacterium]
MTERHYGVLIFSLGLIILFQSLAIGHDASRLESPALTILLPMETAPSGPESEPPAAPSAVATPSSTREQAVAQALSSQGMFVEPLAAPPVEDLTYTMQQGDTFYAVAKQFAMSARDLATANGLARPWAPTGSVLRIPRQHPRLSTEEAAEPTDIVMSYRIRAGDTLANVAERFHMNLSELLTENKLFSGKEPAAGKILRVRIPRVVEYRVGQGESLWKVSKTYQVALGTLVEMNNLALADLKPGQTIQVPVTDPALLDRIWREKHPEARKAAESNRFQFPLFGRITDRYGYRIHPIHGEENFHSGVDIAAPSGAPIHCARPGTVEFVGTKPGYGRLVVVRHADGSQTWYAHCSKLLASMGSKVKAGTLLAKVGSTGSATGPHLHFEIRKNETPVNPLKYLTGARA